MFCDVWTINLYFYLILKRKTKGIKQGEAGTGIIKKSVCEKKVFIIEYFKQLLIRRNSSNSEGYQNSDSVCTTRLESLRCLLHRCSSGQWWRKASEICALLWFKRETERLIPRQYRDFFLSNLYVFLNLMLSLKTKT